MFAKLRQKLKDYDYIILTGCTVGCAVINFFYNFIIKRYVDVYFLGVYSTCSLAITYASYLQLGVLNSYSRDYPIMLGANEHEKGKALKQSTFSFLIIIYSFVMIVSLASMLILYINGTLSHEYVMGFGVNGVLSFLNILYNFTSSTHRVEGKIPYSSLVYTVKTLVCVVVGLVVTVVVYKTVNPDLSYIGLYAGFVVSGIIGLIMCKDVYRGLKIKVEMPVIFSSIKSGFPLLINSFISSVMMSVDKFVILFTMGDEKTVQIKQGYYAVGLMGFTTLVLVPQTCAQVFYVRISKVYGKTKSIPDLLASARNFSRYLSAFTSIGVVGVYYLLPIFISYIIPDYIPSIPSAQILTIGVALYGATMIYGDVFSVLKLNKKLLFNTTVLCILNAVTSITMVLVLGKEIEYVALGTSISYALYSLFLLVSLKRTFKTSLLAMIKDSWLPVISTIVPCVLFSFIIENTFAALFATCVVGGFFLIILFRKEIKKVLFRL